MSSPFLIISLIFINLSVYAQDSTIAPFPRVFPWLLSVTVVMRPPEWPLGGAVQQRQRFAFRPFLSFSAPRIQALPEREKKVSRVGARAAAATMEPRQREEDDAEDQRQFTLVQNLKAAVHYTVGSMCQEAAEAKGVRFTKPTIAAISEVTFRQCGKRAHSLPQFTWPQSLNEVSHCMQGHCQLSLSEERSPAGWLRLPFQL
ncbi:centromere protein S isoform X2 [Antechinus flavipes]|uniref:centromere protein S isoform X2 n=1 Tax=Antechinus flavipes TaxID=38775 RepID=UPI002235CCBD|nr:centromere protein S isoform X2 [Antechinus flavipes]